jgi:ribosomal protein S18 acetylase RimI-like enzyme
MPPLDCSHVVQLGVMHSLCIRSGRAEDADRLAVLATQVWLHTYATGGITVDIAEYVLRELTPEKYLATLGDPTCQIFIAASGESLIGLAIVRFEIPCPAGNYSSAELQTLYVQEHFVGRGVGKSLLRAAETAAKQRSNSVLWLAVNARNARAIAFYAHHGYTKVGTTYFILGEGRHENHVLIGADA